MANAEKILVVQTSFLGDVILTTPLLAEVRRRFPEALLAVLCTPQAEGLLGGNPDIDEVIVDDKRRGGFRALRTMAAHLRQRRFTVALSPHRSLRTALLLYLAKIPCRIGFRQSAGWFLFHRRVERDSRRHDVDRNLSLLEAWGIDTRECGRELRIAVTPQARQAVAELFRALGINGDRSRLVFGLHPGSVWHTKRWSREGYAELAVRLRQRYGAQVLLFGGPQDTEVVEAVQELSGHAGINLTGKLNLNELAGALERCDVFISNDSAPMHLAVARDVPVVAIFCATTPALGFYPYSSRAVVVEKALHCRPCAPHGGRRCPLGTEACIRSITAEQVLAAVDRLLERKKLPLPNCDACLPEFMTI